jgi:tetratricopeptide (TPR) repeat protein
MLLDEQELTLLERELPERVHLFRHALLQEVAYQSLLYARRRELHRRIGEYLERRYTENPEPYYGLLAHHYRLSDQRDKALTYLLLAGHAACAEYANDDALQYYRWAHELLYAAPSAGAPEAAEAQRWELHNAFGDVLSTVGRYDEAMEQYGTILQHGSPPAVAAEAHRDRGSALEKQGQYTAALDELNRAERLCREWLDDVPPLLLSEVCADKGLVLMRLGEYEAALAMCREGLHMLRRDKRSREDERIEARLHSQLGTIYGTRGDYPQARHHFGSSLAAQEAIDDLKGMSISNNNIGYVWQLQGEYERAITHYRIAEELGRKINLRYILAFAAINTAYAHYHLSRYADAERDCQAALEICRNTNDQRNIAQIEEMLGLIAYCRGQYAEALDHYAVTLGIHQAAGSLYPAANTLIYQAAAHNALNQLDAAAALAQAALDRAEELRAQQLKLEALNVLAESYLLRGDMQLAALRAAEAATLAASLGSKLDQGIAERLLGEALGAQADAHFLRSIALFEEIKQCFELARSQASYGRALALRGNLAAARSYLMQARTSFEAIGARGELQRLAPYIERSV